MSRNGNSMSLGELAARVGVPGRTIRFYIARGLLPGPRKAGRGARYDEGHRERLDQIRSLQNDGLTLAEVGRRLAGETSRGEVPLPTTWCEYAIAEDVVVKVSGDTSPWRLRQIREQIVRMTSELRHGNEMEGV